MPREIVIIAHNIRSAHNVGSILRSADGFGIKHVYLSGYTPYPQLQPDTRLPHLASKITSRIAKTSLGAEKTQGWSYAQDIKPIINSLKSSGYIVAALEIGPESTSLPDFKPPSKLALLLGNEVQGIGKSMLAKADISLEIPMHGRKESYNVAVAAAIAMYHLCYCN